MANTRETGLKGVPEAVFVETLYEDMHIHLTVCVHRWSIIMDVATPRENNCTCCTGVLVTSV